MPSRADEDRIDVTCPSCAAQYLVPARKRGKRSRCKRCDETFLIYSDQDLNRHAQAEAHVTVACPYCDRRYTAKRRKLGKSIYCKGCTRQFRLVPIGAKDVSNTMADQLQVHPSTPSEAIDANKETLLGAGLSSAGDLQPISLEEASSPPDIGDGRAEESQGSGIDLFRFEVDEPEETGQSIAQPPLPDVEKSDETWPGVDLAQAVADVAPEPDQQPVLVTKDDALSEPALQPQVPQSLEENGDEAAAASPALGADQADEFDDIEPGDGPGESEQVVLPGPASHMPCDQASELRELASEFTEVDAGSEQIGESAGLGEISATDMGLTSADTTGGIKPLAQTSNDDALALGEEPVDDNQANASDELREDELAEEPAGCSEELGPQIDLNVAGEESGYHASPAHEPPPRIVVPIEAVEDAGPQHDKLTQEQSEEPAAQVTAKSSPDKAEIEAAPETTADENLVAPASRQGEQPVQSQQIQPEPVLDVAKPWTRTASFNGHLAPVSAIAVSPDGQALAAGDTAGELRLWDLASNSLIKSCQVVDGPIWAAAFIGDQRVCVAGPKGAVLIRDFADEDAPLAQFEAHPAGLTAVSAASRDGKPVLLTAGKDRVPYLWDVDTQKILKRFVGHRDRVSAVALSPDGETTVTASWDGSIRVWCTRTGSQEALLVHPEHRWLVLGIDWEAGIAWAGGKGGGICRWDWGNGSDRLLPGVHEGAVASIVVRGNTQTAQVLSLGTDRKVVEHAREVASKPAVPLLLDNPVSQAAASGAEGLVVAGYQPEVVLYAQG